jgi:hypothetical protein
MGGNMRTIYTVMVGKPARKRPFEKRGGQYQTQCKSLEEIRVNVWTGFIWLKTRSSGGLL